MAKKKAEQQTNRVKLLVGIINKEDESRFTEIVNECATAVHFSGVGHGTARSSYMTYFGFNEIEKRLTMSLIPASAEHNILSAVGHGLKLYLVGRGIAFTMPLSGISSIINDAVLSGVETRTSSPVRMPRNEVLVGIGCDGVYPCGEGAGYAGGITSAAVDGIKTALEIMKRYAPIE